MLAEVQALGYIRGLEKIEDGLLFYFWYTTSKYIKCIAKNKNTIDYIEKHFEYTKRRAVKFLIQGELTCYQKEVRGGLVHFDTVLVRTVEWVRVDMIGTRWDLGTTNFYDLETLQLPKRWINKDDIEVLDKYGKTNNSNCR